MWGQDGDRGHGAMLTPDLPTPRVWQSQPPLPMACAGPCTPGPKESPRPSFLHCAASRKTRQIRGEEE